MINLNKVKRFCNEDISNIENYEKALNDETQTWHCHHRLEIDLSLSAEDLINKNLYYKRPACELIFLTPYEHKSLHGFNIREETRNRRSKSLIGKNVGKVHSKEQNKHHSDMMKGRKQTEESNEKRAEKLRGHKPTKETKIKQSESKLGIKNPIYGKHRVYDNKELNIFHYE